MFYGWMDEQDISLLLLEYDEYFQRLSAQQQS